MIDSCFPAYFTTLFAMKDYCLRDSRYPEICLKFLDVCFEGFTVVEWRKIMATFFADYFLLEVLVAAPHEESCIQAFIDFFNRFLADELTYSELCNEVSEKACDLRVLQKEQFMDIVPVCVSFIPYYRKVYGVGLDRFWADVFMWFFSAVEQIKTHKQRNIKA